MSRPGRACSQAHSPRSAERHPDPTIDPSVSPHRTTYTWQDEVRPNPGVLFVLRNAVDTVPQATALPSPPF
jgi:hypothetical protein